MFFMFHILILTICICEFGCVARKINNRKFSDYINENNENSSMKDVQKNKTYFATRTPLFGTLIKSQNLRSNVFDKMLSDEMLSMKQRLFDQELQASSNKKVSSQNAAQTPTLEMKQKWPAVDLMTRTDVNDKPLQTNNEEEKPQKTTQIEPANSDEENILEDNSHSSDSPEEKNLDVRAIIPNGVDPIHPPNHILTANSCSCMKHNNQGHHHAHGDGCTRNPSDFPYAYSMLPYYFQYQPFSFNYDNQEMPSVYYIPQPPSFPPALPTTTSKRKKKKSKPRKLPSYDENMYYDDLNDDRNDKDINENKGGKFIIGIDYDLVDKKNPSQEDLLDELDKAYKAEVEKKCYCSLSRQNTQTCRIHLYAFVVLCLLNF